MKNYKCQFGIKYSILKVPGTNYCFFFPKELVKGEETEKGFKVWGGKEYPTINEKIDHNKNVFVDNIFCDDELAYQYDYEGDDVDFLGEYFWENYKNIVMIVDENEHTSYGTLYRNMFDLKLLDEEEKYIYYMDDSIPKVVLNEDATRKIMDAKELKEVRNIILKYQRGMAGIKKYNDSHGVTRISMTDGKVNYYETTRPVNQVELDEVIQNGGVIDRKPVVNRDISYQGLRSYLKERIFGHDKEIDAFAQKLYMNYTAEKGESIESVLFVGPTGTGKTETIGAACEYLGIPMNEVNASNLVPRGYEGTSIEDVIIGLYERAGGDIERAQRGLIFLDEFDKMNAADLELKAGMKPILLTFTSGGKFSIRTNHYNFIFDTSMVNKIYAGVFERIMENPNPIGFGLATKKSVPTLGSDEDIRKKIVNKKYFTQEELTRISTILAYNDMPRDVKKDIVLHSKLSEYVKKYNRWKRQFGIELVIEDDFLEAVLDLQANTSSGMRCIYNSLKKSMDIAERTILEGNASGYKKLVLTRDTVDNPSDFKLRKK